MDKYIDRMKANVFEVKRSFQSASLSEDSKHKLNTIEIASIHALAACEQAKQLERIADILDGVTYDGSVGVHHNNKS